MWLKKGFHVNNILYINSGFGYLIKVAVFKDDYGENWISSEVPFGIVIVIDKNGITQMELYGFSISGAKRDISKEEAENAKSIFDFDFDDFDFGG